MTAKHALAGAASHATVDWQVIRWPQIHRNVRRLQARIVKATQEGRWGKVKALQRLLTRSFSGKALAVKRVTDNRGKRTPGVDGATWPTPAEKAAAIPTLRHRGYKAQPLRRVYIPKRDGQRRPLGIPTMRDRAMQALHLLALDPIAETTGDPNSYGFRPARSPADAIAQCFTLLARRTAPAWVLEGDIQACFDGISHAWLEAHVPMERGPLHQWLKAGYLDQRVLYPTDAGTPQGGICSPVLANLTLDGLERELNDRFPRRHRYRPKVHLVRFADDFIITGADRSLLEHEVQPLVERFLRARGLALSPEKTAITHIADGFDFLGQTVRKHRGKLIIKPAAKQVQAFLEDVRAVIKAHPQTTAGHLILRLTPLIRGWAHYHRHVVSARVFSAVDHAIHQSLWRWARRRHPTKPRRWIKGKYFPATDERQWVFQGVIHEDRGKPQRVPLFRAASVPIRRHVKVQSAANPYDPAWEAYFEARLGVKMAQRLKGRRGLLYLWKEQDGICPVCGQKITELTGWHSHHIVWRTQGGPDGAANRVLLHPECHRQVHSLRLKVVKPRPARGV